MKHRRSIALLAFAGSLTVALPAAAHDKNALNAREVVHCMQARMKANQSESYREAFKVCKQQLDPSSRGSVATTSMNTASEHPQQK